MPNVQTTESLSIHNFTWYMQSIYYNDIYYSKKV